jgi:hypothetical protein
MEFLEIDVDFVNVPKAEGLAVTGSMGSQILNSVCITVPIKPLGYGSCWCQQLIEPIPQFTEGITLLHTVSSTYRLKRVAPRCINIACIRDR